MTPIHPSLVVHCSNITCLWTRTKFTSQYWRKVGYFSFGCQSSFVDNLLLCWNCKFFKSYEISFGSFCTALLDLSWLSRLCSNFTEPTMDIFWGNCGQWTLNTIWEHLAPLVQTLRSIMRCHKTSWEPKPKLPLISLNVPKEVNCQRFLEKVFIMYKKRGEEDVSW